MDRVSDWNDNMIADFRANDGQTGRFGNRLVLMHTVGAKSGKTHVIPVLGLPQSDDGWLVIASAAGSPKHPGWYHNIVAQPSFEVESANTGSITTSQVSAHELDDSEYAAGWAQFTALGDTFLDYEKKTEGRRMPIFRLTKV
jgi:deazaflavin-dependent oxidoreductase (nitroreductase family)